MNDNTAAPFVRVDDRLIHGQVVTTWVKHLGIRQIWVVSNRAAAEPLEIILLKSSVPAHITLEVFSVDEAAKAWERTQPKQIMLLMDSLQDVFTLCESGVPIQRINLGGLRYQPGRVGLTRAVYVDANDVQVLRRLEQCGKVVEVRGVPSEPGLDAYELIRRKCVQE